MKPDDLDRILSTDDGIVPASGFTASVMELVRTEASAPPPIRFPWVRLAAGVAAVIALAGWLASSDVTEPLRRLVASPDTWSALLAGAVDEAARTGAPWIAGALLVAFASWRLAMRSVWPQA